MRLKLKEPRIRRGVTLNSLIAVSSSLDAIIKESYRNLTSAPARSRVPELAIYAEKFENGSVATELMVQIANTAGDPKQIPFALANFRPGDVLTVAKNAIEYWKVLAGARASGQSLNVTAAPNSLVLVNTGSGNITVGDVVLNTASAISRPGDKMLHPLKSGELETIELSEAGAPPLLLDSGDADCFNIPTEVDESLKRRVGDLIALNKKKRTGTFAYIEDGRLVARPFELVGNANVIEAIDSMKQNRCRMSFHEEYMDLPDNRRAILRLQVLKIEVL